MTQRNNILLIVKQSPGIDYNSLLNKVSSSYGSVNSARAALSRALKDLNALGMLKRKGNNFFVTEKGAAEISGEMKNKLLIKLNQSLASKNPVDEIDKVVEMLSTLIQRSKQDRDLLKAARGSTEFYLSDLAELQTNLGKRIHTLQYLGKIMGQHISSLEELDFNDRRRLSLNSESKKTISNLISESGLSEISAEFRNPALLEKFCSSLALKSQGNSVSIASSKLPALLKFIDGGGLGERNAVSIYLPSLILRIDAPYVYFIGPFGKLESLFGKAP